MSKCRAISLMFLLTTPGSVWAEPFHGRNCDAAETNKLAAEGRKITLVQHEYIAARETDDISRICQVYPKFQATSKSFYDAVHGSSCAGARDLATQILAAAQGKQDTQCQSERDGDGMMRLARGAAQYCTYADQTVAQVDYIKAADAFRSAGDAKKAAAADLLAKQADMNSYRCDNASRSNAQRPISGLPHGVEDCSGGMQYYMRLKSRGLDAEPVRASLRNAGCSI